MEISRARSSQHAPRELVQSPPGIPRVSRPHHARAVHAVGRHAARPGGGGSGGPRDPLQSPRARPERAPRHVAGARGRVADPVARRGRERRSDPLHAGTGRRGLRRFAAASEHRAAPPRADAPRDDCRAGPCRRDRPAGPGAGVCRRGRGRARLLPRAARDRDGCRAAEVLPFAAASRPGGRSLDVRRRECGDGLGRPHVGGSGRDRACLHVRVSSRRIAPEGAQDARGGDRADGGLRLRVVPCRTGGAGEVRGSPLELTAKSNIVAASLLQRRSRMRSINRQFVSAAVCLGLSAMFAAPVLAQKDSQVGVWKLNVAKSKYSPGPAPTTATTTIEAAGAGTKVSVDQTLPDGTKRQYSFTSNYDGKDVPVTGTNPDADTVARTRVNATTVKTVGKKGGKVTTTQTSTVSADGKTRTVTTTGTNGKGQAVKNVAVYDRQ